MSADRRALLRGLAALPFAAVPAVAISTQAGAAAADPFVTYHARILALHDAIEAGPGDDVAERLMNAWGDIDHEALAGQPTTLAGALGALLMARREYVQFQLLGNEATDDPSKRITLHLLDGAIGVLRQATTGGLHV